MRGFLPLPPGERQSKLWMLYLAGSVAVNLGLMIGLVLYGGFAVSMIYGDLSNLALRSASQDWSSVEGKILESGVYRRGNNFGPFAKYSYRVSDSDFTGNRLLFAAEGPLYETEAEARESLKPIRTFEKETEEFAGLFNKSLPPPNRSITVYYDPVDPTNSVLKRDFVSTADFGHLALIAVVSTFVIVCIVLSVKRWWKFFADRRRPVESV